MLRQIAMILVSAPAGLRESLTVLSEKALLERLAAARPGTDPSRVETASLIGLRSLAGRHRA